MSLDFLDAVLPPDTTPELSDVEYPCRVCGKEAGPYSGRGPKPKLCPDDKKPSSKGTRKVTGAPANLAGQATAVLVQLNGIIAIGLMAVGLNETAGALVNANVDFEEKAYQALLTDPELCKMLLKGGVKSAKVGLGIAYFGAGVSVAPIAVAEVRARKAERDARREEEDDAAGT